MIQSAQFLKAFDKKIWEDKAREIEVRKMACLFISVGRVEFSPEISRLSAIPKEMDGNFIFTLNIGIHTNW